MEIMLEKFLEKWHSTFLLLGLTLILMTIEFASSLQITDFVNMALNDTR